MSRSGSSQRISALVAASLLAGLMLAGGAAPALADNFGESETVVFLLGDTVLQYGEPIRMKAWVSDDSDSCGSVGEVGAGCDTPHGRVDFYAVAGATQRFMTSAELTSGLGETLSFWINSTGDVEYCCLPIGSYDSIRGYYVPEDFDPSSGDEGPVTVEKNGSTITLQGPSTVQLGAGAEFSVHLAGYEDDPNAIKPTGFVDVYEGPTNYGTVPVDANGDATLMTTQLPLGQHDLRARWGGDEHWTASTSAPLHVTVGGGTTSTTISASTTSTTYGAPVTLTGTVVPVNPPDGTPTGPVGFHEGLSFLGSGDLNEASPNVATLTTNELAVGSHILFAVYTGDGVWVASTSSNTVTVNVSKASTTTTVTSTANPSTFGQAVTFTATVDGPGTTTVPGTVQFKDGATNLGAPQSLLLGQASLTVGSLGGGSHSITAVYSGSANYLASTSSALTQTVACDQLITGTVGSVTAGSGSTCLSGAKVTGGITVSNGASLSIVNSTVTGSVTLTAPATSSARIAAAGASGVVTICGSTISGNVKVAGLGGFVLVGDVVDAACAGNTIKGNLTIAGTTGGLAVADNKIGGAVTIANNTATTAPEVKANRISGYLYAYGNSPAVTDDGRANIVRGWVVLG